MAALPQETNRKHTLYLSSSPSVTFLPMLVRPEHPCKSPMACFTPPAGKALNMLCEYRGRSRAVPSTSDPWWRAYAQERRAMISLFAGMTRGYLLQKGQHHKSQKRDSIQLSRGAEGATR